jgi:hypothetical protein
MRRKPKKIIVKTAMWDCGACGKLHLTEFKAVVCLLKYKWSKQKKRKIDVTDRRNCNALYDCLVLDPKHSQRKIQVKYGVNQQCLNGMCSRALNLIFKDRMHPKSKAKKPENLEAWSSASALLYRGGAQLKWYRAEAAVRA